MQYMSAALAASGRESSNRNRVFYIFHFTRQSMTVASLWSQQRRRSVQRQQGPSTALTGSRASCSLSRTLTRMSSGRLPVVPTGRQNIIWMLQASATTHRAHQSQGPIACRSSSQSRLRHAGLLLRLNIQGSAKIILLVELTTIGHALIQQDTVTDEDANCNKCFQIILF